MIRVGSAGAVTIPEFGRASNGPDHCPNYKIYFEVNEILTLP